MSVTITSIKDPFNEFRNVIQEKEYNGGVLSDYLDYTDLNAPDITYIVCINGVEIKDKNTCINDGDKISVVAKVELTAVTEAIVGSAWADVTGWAMVEYAAVYATLAVGFSYGMGALVQALGPDIPTGSTKREEQTYGWEEVTQTHSEGIRIPYIFGANKVHGQVINQFVDLDGNKETLNVLLGICDHQVDSITDIEINDQPSTYYRDIEVYTRLGTNSDAIIDGFNDIVTQTNVDSKLIKDTPVIQQTSGDVVQKINIFLVAKKGIYYISKNGHIDPVNYNGHYDPVNYKIEYRLVGATSWTLKVQETWDEFSTQTLRKEIVIDDLPYGQYEVQVTRTSNEPTGNRAYSTIYFSSMQEVVKEPLTYPGLAKYAVKVLATDQLSGIMPTFSCIAERSHVKVFDKNLTTPIWTENKRATSPAWVVYSLLTEFAGIDQDRLVWEDFSEWADYCDEIVDGAPRFVINTVVNSGDFWTQIQKIARYGRANIIRRGTDYGVFVDKYEGDPPIVSHLFTMGNILENSFSMQYLSQKDRVDAVEIEYNDVDRDYTKQVLTAFSNDYLTENTEGKKANVVIEASITQPQVLREAIFRINSNKYLIRTITFDASIDSFACTVGDLFYFQHETIDYANDQTGSRVIEAGNDDGNGNPYVKIDQEVTINAATYKITVRLEDDTLVEKTVTNAPSTTDILTVSTPWSSLPKLYDVFLFGPVDTYKKIYRLINISRKDDFTRTITGFEYVPEIYLDNDSYVIEEPEYAPKVQEAVQVGVSEFLSYEQDGSYKSNLNVSWSSVYTQVGQTWSIWLEDTTAGTPPVRVDDAYSRQYTIDSDLVLGDTYKVYVVPFGQGAIASAGNTSSITIQGKLAPPSDVTNFISEWDAGRNAIHFTWDAVDDIDLAKYEIRQGSVWDTASLIIITVSTSVFLQIETGVSETREYLIKAVDTSGIYSLNPSSTSVAVDTTHVNDRIIDLNTEILDSADSNVQTIGDIIQGGIDQDELALLNIVQNAETINQLPGIANGIQNFNTRNDRITVPVENPSIPTDGTAISYSFNSDGTANIDFKWNYGSGTDATNIDGFNVYIDMMNESVAPTSWDGVKFYNVLATQTMFRFSSLTTDKYYWIGIEAYRIVDQDLVPDGLLRSDLIIPSLAAEAPVHLKLDVPAPVNVSVTEV